MIALIDVMKEFGCKNLVFSSSATVYGDPHTVPITEDFPLSTTNPYGSTKLFIEYILKDLYKSDNSFNIAILRYFNPVGAHESGMIGEDPNGIPNNLSPYITQVAIGKRPYLNVFGNDYNTPDGTGVRDYIHVVDLAIGHVQAVKKLLTNSGLFIVNLGTGVGYSVLDMVKAFSKALGKEIPYKIVDRRRHITAEDNVDSGEHSHDRDNYPVGNIKGNVEQTGKSVVERSGVGDKEYEYDDRCEDLKNRRIVTLAEEVRHSLGLDLLSHKTGAPSENDPGKKGSDKSVTETDPCGCHTEVPSELSGIAYENYSGEVGSTVSKSGEPGTYASSAKHEAVDVCGIAAASYTDDYHNGEEDDQHSCC